jgi:thiosulfate/3-mercaptopyruvate sulfurtransferase
MAASKSGPLKGARLRWVAERLPTGDFTAASRPSFFVDKHAVLAARSDPSVVVINALGPQFHKGLEPSRYGRPGRIPGSISVPAATLYDPATKTFASAADAERQFTAQGVTKEKRVIAYSGGGISATIDLLLLRRLGYENLMLYDGSMGEWATDC